MTKQKTILLSINTSWNIYHFRASLVRALRAQGYRVITAAPEDAYSERLRAMVDAHYPLPMDNAGTSPVRDARLFLRYMRLLRQVKPDILLTYTIKPNIYGALAARLVGVPIIANVSGLGTAFLRDNWMTRVVKQLYRVAFARIACVFFQNAEDRDLFVGMKLLRPEKAALLAGSGVDLDFFHPDHAPSTRPDAPLRFVLIARLLWDKGVGEFIEAARIVKARYPAVQFHLVGAVGVQNQTAIPAETLAQWEAEGVVEYLGETEDARAIIAAHDCVVLPSYREGMSRVLLEAAAMGKPLIATDVAGCRQIVTHRENGLLCRVRDAQHLAATLLDFLALPADARAEMGRKSRIKAEREFDEKRVIAAYLERIAEIAS